KFSWMFMSHETSTIFTDHKPLTYFMDSHLVHGIYSRWAEELNLLNVKIDYVPGERNRIADALSRTVFPNEDCSIDEILAGMGSMTWDNDNQPRWVWKDGTGGYQDLLDAYQVKDQHERPSDQVIQSFAASIASSTRPIGQTIPPAFTQEETFVGSYGPEDIAFEVYLSTVAGNNEAPPPSSKYTNDEWYGEIYNFLLFAKYPPARDRIQQLSLQRRASDFRLVEGDLFKVVRGVMKRALETPVNVEEVEWGFLAEYDEGYSGFHCRMSEVWEARECAKDSESITHCCY
ncbi:hypothetical protein K3495_g15650, partial [Podosphaera aphanis]